MSFPTRALIKPLILDLLADRSRHSSDESQARVTALLGLNEVQLALRLNNGHGAFQNEHAFALNELMRAGYVEHDGRLKGSQAYKITSQGRMVGRAEKTLAGEQHRRLWKEVDAQELARAEDQVRRSSPRPGTRTPASPRGNGAASSVAAVNTSNLASGLDKAPAANGQPSSLTRHDQRDDGTRRTVGSETHPPVEGYEYWRREARVSAEQRELELVSRFKRFLAKRGYRYRQEQLRVGQTWITYDLFDASRRILFEAKADALAREQIRMAIGQLFDYGYHGFAQRRDVHRAIPLPNAPRADVTELLDTLEIGIAHETSRGEFVENYPWI